MFITAFLHWNRAILRRRANAGRSTPESNCVTRQAPDEAAYHAGAHADSESTARARARVHGRVDEHFDSRRLFCDGGDSRTEGRSRDSTAYAGTIDGRSD